MPRPFHLRDRWMLWRWRVAGHAVSEVSCCSCGYPVRALAGPICPECGADRNVVGTIALLPPLLQQRGVRIATWWVIVVALAFVADSLLRVCIPKRLSYHEDYILTPHSQLYGPLPLRRIGYSSGWPSLGPYAKSPKVAGTAATPIPASAFGGKFMTAIDVHPHARTGSYAITIVEGNSHFPRQPVSGDFNAAFIVGWLSRLEIDTNREDVRAEAAELADLMLAPRFDAQAYLRLKRFDAVVTQKWSSAQASPGDMDVARTTVWPALGALGTFVIVARSRRRARLDRAGAVLTAPGTPQRQTGANRL